MIVYKGEGDVLCAINPDHIVKASSRNGNILVELSGNRIAMLHNMTFREFLELVEEDKHGQR